MPAPRRVLARVIPLLALVALSACAGPDPTAPPRAGAVRLDGRVVSWSSNQSTLGAVRWGRRAGAPDHVAYPGASDRDDLRFTTTHRVVLLGASDGDSVYVQVLDRASSGALVASEEHGFLMSHASATARLMTWHLVDVGFGDAHVLEMPESGRRVLIDCGERRDEQNVERFLDGRGIASLDVAMLTHAHEDHIGGFVGEAGLTDDGVLARTPVGRFLDTPDHAAPRYAYEELVALLSARGIPRATVASGETDATNPALAWDPAVRVHVLHAGGGASLGGETESDRLNNDSVVLRLTYGAVSFVLGGDAESPVQAALLAEGATLAASVLKVHHHGASDASEPAYLAAVGPRVGWIPISTDESLSGTLPSGVVLDRLRSRRIDVYACDRAEPLGLSVPAGRGLNLSVVTDGSSYEVGVAASRSTHFPPDDSSEHAARASEEARP